MFNLFMSLDRLNLEYFWNISSNEDVENERIIMCDSYKNDAYILLHIACGIDALGAIVLLEKK